MENEHGQFPGELPFEFNKPDRDDALKAKSRQELLQGIATALPHRGRRYKRLLMPVLTVCILLSGLLLFFNNKRGGRQMVIQTGNFQRALRLPDGSDIVLNNFSEIKMDSANWSNTKREVWLSGEAFFEIRKVKASGDTYQNFMVHTLKGDIEVLGTSFNVSTDTAGFSVALHTGSVKAHIGKNEVISLVPGQVLVVQGTAVYKKDANVQLYSAWKDGEFHFDHTSLADIIILIEKYYGIKVKVAADVPVAEKRLSGNIAVKDATALFNALQVIMDLKVQQTDDSLIISK